MGYYFVCMECGEVLIHHTSDDDPFIMMSQRHDCIARHDCSICPPCKYPKFHKLSDEDPMALRQFRNDIITKLEV